MNSNLTSDGATTFVCDAENRLVSASGAKNATLSYDPMGRLFQISAATGTTQFLYDGDELVAEYNGIGGSLLRRYVHGPAADDPLLWYEGAGLATRRGLFANHQGSIVAVADANGNSVGINAYDAYGVPNSGNMGRFQYTGQAWLAELGLYHYKARLYSPTLGRFLQTDPIGYDDDVNLYAYTGNDPLNNVDPLGLWSKAAHDLILQRSLEGRVNANFIRWAQTGSAATDTYRQFDNGAHSLRNVGQSIQSAVAARQGFIDRSMGAALVSARLGDVNRAAMFFGQAMHAVMDKYSPAHATDGVPNEYAVTKGHTFTQGHSPTDGMGRETSADVTPELQEKMTQEIAGHLNKLKDAADEGTKTRMGWHMNGDLITGVRCTGRLACPN